jgi:ligand-binding sensor domain-containing protein
MAVGWYTPCVAQPNNDFTPVFRNYSTDQGLPDNWVFGIVQDQKGFIWTTTRQGVCKFDGYRFEQLRDTLLANQTSVLTQCIKEDACGRIWWVDFNSRVFYMDHDRIIPWQMQPAVDSIKQAVQGVDFFFDIKVSGCGDTVWLISRTMLGYVTRQGDWDVLHNVKPHSIVDYHPGSKTAIVRSGISTEKSIDILRITPQDTILLTSAPGSSYLGVAYYMDLPDGTYLVANYGFIAQFSGPKLLWRREVDQPNMVGIRAWADGRIILLHHRGGGAYLYDNTEDLRLNKGGRHLLPDLSVVEVMRDREGGWWFGTQERGLFYSTSIESGTPPTQVMPPNQPITATVYDAQQGNLYAITRDSRLYALNTLTNQVVYYPSPYIRQNKQEGSYTTDMVMDHATRRLAILGSMLQVFDIRQKRWIDLNYFNPYDKRTLISSHTFIPIGQERYLGLVIDKINVIDQGKRQSSDAFPDLPKHRMFSFCRDAVGRFWASDRDGLFEIKDGRLVRPVPSHPVLQQQIIHLLGLSDTSLAICTKGHGLVLWRPGQEPRLIGAADKLISNRINRVVAESDTVLWACSQQGASRVVLRLDGTYQIENYTIREGLPSNAVNDVEVTPDYYWFSTDRGLYRMRRHRQSPMPTPILTKFGVLGVEYGLHGNYVLSPDSNSIVIEYASLDYASSGAIQYRYRLIGTGSNHLWALTTDRMLNFPSLSSGLYWLEVCARNPDGSWTAPMTIKWYINSYWYQTRSFRILVLLGIIGSIWVYFLYRFRMLRRAAAVRDEMIRLEQSAMQAQMNPHFIFNCLNSIQQFIAANNPDLATRYLSTFAKLVRNTLNSSVAGQVSLEDELQMLDQYLQLERLRFEGRFDYRIEVDPSLDQFDTLLPSLIIQPFVENAVIHGMRHIKKDGLITIRILPKNSYLAVEISDNGSGFDPSSPQKSHAPAHKSLGMSRTERRFELLRNKYDDPSIGFDMMTGSSGTTIDIRLPL